MISPPTENPSIPACQFCGGAIDSGEDPTSEFCSGCAVSLQDSEIPGAKPWPLPIAPKPDDGLKISGDIPQYLEKCSPDPKGMVTLVLNCLREIKENPPTIPSEDFEIAMEKFSTIVAQTSEEEFSPIRLLLIAVGVLTGPFGWIILLFLLFSRKKSGKKTLYPFLRIDHGRKKPVFLWELREAPLRPAGCEVLTPKDFQDVLIGFRWNGNNWEGRFGLRMFGEEHMHIECFHGSNEEILKNAKSFLLETISFFPYGLIFPWRVSGLNVQTIVGGATRPVMTKKA
ncbi:hypothetical protein HYY75_09120 [bacterium]|nr:hypothetical protein [bacterium]